jgi:hypothetical protein
MDREGHESEGEEFRYLIYKFSWIRDPKAKEGILILSQMSL